LVLIYCRRKSIGARLLTLDTNRSITKCDSLYIVKYTHKKEFEIKFIAVNVIKFFVIVRNQFQSQVPVSEILHSLRVERMSSVQRNYWLLCVGLTWIETMGKTDISEKFIRFSSLKIGILAERFKTIAVYTILTLVSSLFTEQRQIGL
jgi:hypothetical protein